MNNKLLFVLFLFLISGFTAGAQTFGWKATLKRDINQDSLYNIWLHNYIVISNFNYNISEKDYKPAAAPKKKDLNKYIAEQKIKLKTARDSSDIYLSLANAYMKQLNNAEAQKYYIGAGKMIQKKIDDPNSSCEDNRQAGLFSLYVSGDINGAEISFKKALQLNPNDTLSLNSLVLIKLQRDDTTGAEKYLDTAMMRLPDSPTILLTANILWLYKTANIGDDSLSKICLEKLPLEPFLKSDFAVLPFEKQLLLNQVLHYRLIYKMIVVTENSTKSPLPCDIEKNREIRDFYLANSKRTDIKPYMIPQALGWSYLAEQKYDSAIYFFNKALNITRAYGSEYLSTSTDLLMAISATNLYKKDTLGSIAILRKKILMQDTIGTNLDDYLLLAKLFAGKKDYTNAEWNANIALQRDQTYAAAYRMMTWLASRKNNKTLAEQYCKGATEVNKMSFETYMSNGLFYLVSNDPAKALQQFEAAWYIKKDSQDLKKILDYYFQEK